MAASLLNGEQRFVVTRGSAGSVTVGRDSVWFAPANAAAVVDTTAAGDCFCGYLAAGLAVGHAFETAIASAHRAAALSVGRLGAAASMPYRTEVYSAAED